MISAYMLYADDFFLIVALLRNTESPKYDGPERTCMEIKEECAYDIFAQEVQF